MTDEELKELLGDRFQPRTFPKAEPSAAEDLPKAEQPDADETNLPQEKTVYPEAGAQPMSFPPPVPPPMPYPQDDPFADPFAQTAAVVQAEPEQPQKHPFLTVLFVLLFLAVIGFAVFCIVWDVQRGTASGGYRAGDIIQVEIVQQSRPETDQPLMDENGRYSVEGIAQTVMPSIVEIYTYADGTGVGSGSGIILTADGYIVTNAHVVSGASAYSVHFFDDVHTQESGYDAVLVGHDTKTDIAVLKVSLSGLTPAVLGDSDEVKLGETVCALGSPAGLSGSITTGIISGIHRKVRAQSTNFEMDCFQTDAAISPGNSGGALVDLYGNVIGITSSKYSSSSIFSSGVYEGLGFAITINEALPILTELMEQGYVSGRVRIGIQFLENGVARDKAATEDIDLPKELEGQGIQVVEINDDSDLKNTIFEEGDWILTMNGKAVHDYDSVNEAIEGAVAGDYVHCRCGKVLENGKLETYEIDFRLLEDQSGDY